MIRRNVFAACVLLLAAPAAFAQPGGVRPDSTDQSALLQVLKPSYTTTYNVNRQTTNWVQDFGFGSGFGFFSFNNKTNFNVRTDNGRDEEQRTGTNQTTLRFNLVKRLPFTSNINVGRSSVVRPNDERESNDANLNMNTNYTLLILGVRNTLNGGGGYTFRKDSSVRNESRSESKDSGVSGNVSWRGNWSYKTLTVSSNFREARSSKTSELTREDGSVDTKPTRNTNRTMGFTVNYAPRDWIRGDVAFSNTSGNDEFFIVQGGSGSLEQKVNRNRSLSTTLNITPSDNLSADWKISSTNHDLSYQQRRDIASSGNGLFWESGLLVKDLLGVRIDGTLSSRTDVLEPATSANTETHSNLLDVKFSRDVSSKIGADLNVLVRATQLFFSDVDPGDPILDRDELRTKIQPSLSYTPNAKWKVDASFIRSTNRRVELNPDRSAQTQEAEDYSVDIEFGYQLSPKTRISQNYSIEAAFTTFDFNRRQDRLLSTQRIVTNMQSAITSKVNVSMEHRFTLQDSGPFRFDEDGSRVFARNLRKYRQELSANVDYRVTSWLTVNSHSRFLRTDDVVEATGTRNTTKDLNMQQGIRVQHDLGGAVFSADGQYVQSSTRDSYWTIKSNLTKEF